MDKFKKYGFTLAEVLVTLGVIGIVAALTMPTLMANHQKTVQKAQFKKAYSLFYNAVMQAQAELGYLYIAHIGTDQLPALQNAQKTMNMEPVYHGLALTVHLYLQIIMVCVLIVISLKNNYLQKH